MQRVEQVKILSAKSEDLLATAFNSWYLDEVAAREKVAITKGQPLKILARQMTAQVSGKTRVLYLTIFYEQYLSTEVENTTDEGQQYDKSGFSAVSPRRGARV